MLESSLHTHAVNTRAQYPRLTSEYPGAQEPQSRFPSAVARLAAQQESSASEEEEEAFEAAAAAEPEEGEAGAGAAVELPQSVPRRQYPERDGAIEHN